MFLQCLSCRNTGSNVYFLTINVLKNQNFDGPEILSKISPLSKKIDANWRKTIKDSSTLKIACRRANRNLMLPSVRQYHIKILYHKNESGQFFAVQMAFAREARRLFGKLAAWILSCDNLWLKCFLKIWRASRPFCIVW